MKPEKFPEVNVVFAEDQPEYLPLPAFRDKSAVECPVVVCWKLSARERIALLLTGRIWHMVYTFGMPIQPMLLATSKSEVIEVKGGAK